MASIKVHQIYFKPEQRLELDATFIPYDNSKSERPELCEFFVFRREYLERRIPAEGYHGFLSWKFGRKTSVTGQRFQEFVLENPGYDAYFIHPFPLDLAFGNIWEQGDYYHPYLKSLANHIFDQAGYDLRVENIPANLRITAACNYWVGNKRFWDAYMAYCLPLYDYVMEGLAGSERMRFFSRADEHSKVSYFAYVFERLFTSFLHQHPEVRALAYPYAPAELERKYTASGAALVVGLQKVEHAHPEAQEPMRLDPVLMAGLHYYFRHRYELEFRSAGYHFTKLAWKLMPQRGRLLRLPLIRRLKTRALDRFPLTEPKS